MSHVDARHKLIKISPVTRSWKYILNYAENVVKPVMGESRQLSRYEKWYLYLLDKDFECIFAFI